MLSGFFSNFKPLSSEKYTEIVSNLEFHRIRCSCGQAGCLVRHGYYKRRLKTQLGTITYKILRVRCKHCGHTHAILPETIVPYSQLPVDIQQKMLLFRLGSEELEQILTQNSDITESDVLRIRVRFRCHWKERLASIGADIHIALLDLLTCCYAAFERQFMQVRRGVYCRF